MRQILISGYYGFDNVGDELILSVLLGQLKRKYKNVSTCVLSANWRKTSQLHQTRAVSRWNPLMVLQEMSRSDLLIVGGGGLLQDSTSIRSLIYYSTVMLMGLMFRKKVFLYSLGVEDISSRLGKIIIKQLLNHSLVTITVRDETSKQRLIDCGVKANISITADPVFGIEVPDELGDQKKGDQFLFIPRFPMPAQGKGLFVEIMKKIVTEKRGRVSQVVFSGEREIQKGEFKDFGSLAWRREDKDAFRQLIMEIKSSFIVVSSRYHGLVLAALCKKPFIGIGDPNKTKRLCDLFQMPYLSWNSPPEDFNLAVERVQLEKKLPKPSILSEFREKAIGTIDILEE